MLYVCAYGSLQGFIYWQLNPLVARGVLNCQLNLMMAVLLDLLAPALFTASIEGESVRGLMVRARMLRQRLSRACNDACVPADSSSLHMDPCPYCYIYWHLT
jgi:hypothetical protein